jgi:serine/threonine protein kinase
MDFRLQAFAPGAMYAGYRVESLIGRGASLEHPNVVPIHEAGEGDGQLYLAMRYVEGSDLSTVLAGERTLPPERRRHHAGQDHDLPRHR